MVFVSSPRERVKDQTRHVEPKVTEKEQQIYLNRSCVLYY